MCEAQERNLRATFAIEQMMGTWNIDLAKLRNILNGTNCPDHEQDNNVQDISAATA